MPNSDPLNGPCLSRLGELPRSSSLDGAHPVTESAKVDDVALLAHDRLCKHDRLQIATRPVLLGAADTQPEPELVRTERSRNAKNSSRLNFTPSGGRFRGSPDLFLGVVGRFPAAARRYARLLRP